MSKKNRGGEIFLGGEKRVIHRAECAAHRPSAKLDWLGRNHTAGNARGKRLCNFRFRDIGPWPRGVASRCRISVSHWRARP